MAAPASASEIVAGGVAGSPSARRFSHALFGKGSVQTIIPLGQNNGAVRLTRRAITPHPSLDSGKGIDPDITGAARRAG